MATKSKLKQHQIIAIEKDVKSSTTSEITIINKAFQKPAIFEGFAKDYTPINDEGMKYPPESQRVQFRVPELLQRIERAMSDLFVLEARKDWTNTVAKADVKIGDKVLFKDAPTPFLLFLEKEVKNIETMIGNLPTLDESFTWTKDNNDGLYKSDVVVTQKTAKMETPIVLYAATDKHPAQTQLLTKDVVIGTWATVKQSGAISRTDKQALLERVTQLMQAVKIAREEANAVDELESPDVATAIFEFLFPTAKAE